MCATPMLDFQQQLQELRSLDDDSLLHSLKRHVGSANRIDALVLAHLAEVDARGAYRKWACETLAAYCVYELRLSEDEAQRRCRAVRVMRQFPVLFEMVADASIHLTGILLLAPYLTVDNHAGVLVRARYRSKREIERLAAELAPPRDVPALVEPLGVVSGSHTIPGKSWAALTEGTLGWVRHLEPGDGPARAPSAPDDFDQQFISDVGAEAAGGSDDSRVLDVQTSSAPARGENPEALRPSGSGGTERPQLHYRVQFTADQAYVDLLEQARSLLWHQLPSGDLVELQRLALQALVDKLAKRKCGAKTSQGGAHPQPGPTGGASPGAAPARDATDQAEELVAEPLAPMLREPAPGSRHIPTAVRREVWERDGGHCAFVDARGQRCRAASAIEFHHLLPHARGGPATPANLGLRCRPHNQLEAEEDFGRDFMMSVQQRSGECGASPTVPPDPGLQSQL